MSGFSALSHVDLTTIPGAPSPRAAHTCDVVQNFLVIFGGWSGREALGDAYAFHLKKKRWYLLNLRLVESSGRRVRQSNFVMDRNNHASAVYNNELFVYAGHDGSKWLGDMFAIDVGGLEESVSGLKFGQSVDVHVRIVEGTGKVPTRRACHSMTLVGQLFYTFGGYDGNQCFNDLDVFDPTLNSWSRLSKPHGKKPAARNAHAMVTDGRNLYLLGGHSGSVHFDDVHMYSINSHTWTCLNCEGRVPPGVRGHSSAFHKGEIYLFGGYNGDVPFNTLYVFNLRSSTWSIQDVSYDEDIERRQRCTMVTLPDGLYIFGGFNGTNWLNDLHSIKFYNTILSNILYTIFIYKLIKLINCLGGTNNLNWYVKNVGGFMNSNAFSDVTIMASGKEIPAHKLILAANSPYFLELLSNDNEEQGREEEHTEAVNGTSGEAVATEKREPKKAVIELNEWSFDCVMKLLEFLYTAKVEDLGNSSHYRVCEILGLADACSVVRLKNLCEEVLVTKLDIENSCYLLKYSKLYNADYLRQCCFDFISENAADVMLTPGFEDLSSLPSLVLELAKLSINKMT
uniref:Kelch motif/Galactose oxidase, central domain/BTB/POZ domain containing protein, putative n=1 Tax=Theileria annulata TaxID=5874 RepID=A0A3B0MVG7_THEAN